LYSEAGVSAIEKSRFKFDITIGSEDNQDSHSHSGLVIDARRFRNQLAYVNDPRDFKRGTKRQTNAVFEVDHKLGSWTHVFIRTTRNVAPGAEVLADYGDSYWDVLAKLSRDTA